MTPPRGGAARAPGAARAGRVARAALLALAWAASWASAQGPSTGGAPAAEPEIAGVGPDTVPAVASFGVQFGFPAYRTAGVSAGLQARFVGVAVHAGGGPGGVAFGLEARAYPPVPVPLPLYLAGGVDLYAGRTAPYVALGAHLPIGGGWRLDVAAGVAWTPLLDEVQIAPLVAVGTSYAVPLELSAADAAPTAPAAVAGRAGGPACDPGPPDPSALDAALAATVRRFVADAVAAYGSVYRDLSYRTSVASRRLEGDRATLTVRYAGSVVEILTGRRVEASGEAEVDFRWDGCRWRRSGLRY